MSDKAKELAEWVLKRADYRAATGDLHDANQLDRIAAELTRLAEVERALRAVRDHVEVSSPTGYRFSTVWNIADRALGAKDKGE